MLHFLNMNLLIVEDDDAVRAFLIRALSQEGYIVDDAIDGKIALQKATLNTYDLIILDYNLPYKNGKEFCEEVRSSGIATPILMLSVKADTLTKVDMLNIGADDYVTKPFVFGELLARVRALLRRPLPIKDTVIQVGDVILDTDKHLVTTNGTEVLLTPKEFSLLEYLMSNHGRILSRMSILEHVWGVNADPFTNTIETHVFNLRKKLGDKATKELIHTISGVGYKMQ